MNDEFLHALRREPPAAFASQLKKKLQLQTAPQGRRFWDVRALIAVLLVGASAVAAVLFLGGDPSGQKAQPQARSIEPRRSSPWDRLEPGAPAIRPGRQRAPGKARRDVEPQPERTAATAPASIPQPQSEQRAVAIAPGGAVPAAGLVGGTRQNEPRLEIVSAPLTEPLVKMVVDEMRKRDATPPARIEIEEPATQFASLCAPDTSARLVDLVVTSRRITAAELDACRRNGMVSVFESKIGYQAVVLTSGPTATPLKLSPQSLYLALARRVPDFDEPRLLPTNPNVTWDNIDRMAHVRTIEVLGPRPDTILRRTLETLVLETGCDTYPWIKALSEGDPERYADICHALREDRYYREVDQTPSLIPQNLWADPDALVVLDYRFYDAHRAELGRSALKGPEPTYATLADGSYPFSRPVYVYQNRYRVGGARQFRPWESRSRLWIEFEHAANTRFGYLTGPGLVPLDDREREEQRRQRQIPLQPNFEATNPIKP